VLTLQVDSSKLPTNTRWGKAYKGCRSSDALPARALVFETPARCGYQMAVGMTPNLRRAATVYSGENCECLHLSQQ
jgi:hypothetical protein